MIAQHGTDNPFKLDYQEKAQTREERYGTRDLAEARGLPTRLGRSSEKQSGPPQRSDEDLCLWGGFGGRGKGLPSVV